jgi:hypothetical protein
MTSAISPAHDPAASAAARDVEQVNSSHPLLTISIILISFVLLGVTIAVLAIGGRPDPPALRAASPLLDGLWRFHIGDDPHWANADGDDSGWETTDLSAAASSHDGDVGLPNYVGRMVYDLSLARLQKAIRDWAPIDVFHFLFPIVGGFPDTNRPLCFQLA